MGIFFSCKECKKANDHISFLLIERSAYEAKIASLQQQLDEIKTKRRKRNKILTVNDLEEINSGQNVTDL